MAMSGHPAKSPLLRVPQHLRLATPVNAACVEQGGAACFTSRKMWALCPGSPETRLTP